MNYVDPTAWTNLNNPDSIGVNVGGLSFSVQNAKRGYSLTTPAAGTLRFELHPGDKWAGDGTALKERTEVCGATTYPTGAAIHVAYGFMVEPGAANKAGWLVTGQFHQVENDGRSPPFEIDLVGEKMAVLVNYLRADGTQAYKTVWTDPNPIQRGRKYAMQIDAEFDATAGKLVVSRDGVQIVNYAGPMGFPGMKGTYWKEGLYRSASDTTIAADYSDLSITTGAVVPTVPAPPVVTPAPTADQVRQLQAQVRQQQDKISTAVTALNAALAALSS